ncbi:hypothetical protein [Xanthomonas arboricola]|uniref:hypothetical protein n=1 Tax=Xanthomonas arboricola TaxID=56448 RepID=UPI000CEE24E9|nr:hypothetical protein [Xanthomonas arboricola]
MLRLQELSQVHPDFFERQPTQFSGVGQLLDEGFRVGMYERLVSKKGLRFFKKVDGKETRPGSQRKKVHFTFKLSDFIRDRHNPQIAASSGSAQFNGRGHLFVDGPSEAFENAVGTYVSGDLVSSVSCLEIASRLVVLQPGDDDRRDDGRNTANSLHPRRRIFAEVDLANDAKRAKCQYGAYRHPARSLERPLPADLRICIHAHPHSLKVGSIRKVELLGEYD